jgi:epoxyqueuosine reductase
VADSLRVALQAQAGALGFNLFGLAPATPAPTLPAYLDWIAAGYHGEMAYLARPDRLARRQDLQVILPEARSLMIVGLDYDPQGQDESLLSDPRRGRISRYAWGGDYHNMMTPRLEALAAWFAERVSTSVQHKVYVDTGAILERAHAQQAGLGFVGKNTLLIHPRRGSYFFLGEIISTYDFGDYDSPISGGGCGTCRRCLDSCPTEAFPAPYVLDSRRCISYLTIEYKGAIPLELRPQMGNWVYGCDLCQEVCPYVRRFSPAAALPDFYPPSPDDMAPLLADMLTIEEAAFRARYAASPIGRIGHERWLRNACIAAGNSGDSDLRGPLQNLLGGGPSEGVRDPAEWALGRLS